VSIGQAYEVGDGVPQNYVQAAEWYRKAAEHVPDYGGAGQGRNDLGLLYLDGLSLQQDYVEAYKWFTLGGDSQYESRCKEDGAGADCRSTAES